MTLSLPHYLCSLENDLCSQFFRGDGTYTAEGITKLCEGLKRSAVTSLKYAAPPECSPFCVNRTPTLTRAYTLSLFPS